MIVKIDRTGCVSCGTCADSCPAFFELGTGDGLSQVVESYREEGRLDQGQAPPDLEDCVTMAADLCPVQVISTG